MWIHEENDQHGKQARSVPWVPQVPKHWSQHDILLEILLDVSQIYKEDAFLMLKTDHTTQARTRVFVTAPFPFCDI